MGHHRQDDAAESHQEGACHKTPKPDGTAPQQDLLMISRRAAQCTTHDAHTPACVHIPTQPTTGPRAVCSPLPRPRTTRSTTLPHPTLPHHYAENASFLRFLFFSPINKRKHVHRGGLAACTNSVVANMRPAFGVA